MAQWVVDLQNFPKDGLDTEILHDLKRISIWRTDLFRVAKQINHVRPRLCQSESIWQLGE